MHNSYIIFVFWGSKKKIHTKQKRFNRESFRKNHFQIITHPKKYEIEIKNHKTKNLKKSRRKVVNSISEILISVVDLSSKQIYKKNKTKQNTQNIFI